VRPLTVTERGRFVSVAPVGAVTAREVVVAAVTTAFTPPIYTVLFSAIGLKLVPVITTVDPTGPLSGEELVIVGACADVWKVLTVMKTSIHNVDKRRLIVFTPGTFTKRLSILLILGALDAWSNVLKKEEQTGKKIFIRKRLISEMEGKRIETSKGILNLHILLHLCNNFITTIPATLIKHGPGALSFRSKSVIVI
jgi:hypothetical protein